MRKIIYLVLLVLFALSCINATRNQSKPNNADNSINQAQGMTNNDFQSFWINFRSAIISLDYIKLMEMTDFPLKCKSKTDVDPQLLIFEDRFYYFLKECLNEKTGRAMEGETNLDFIKRTSKLEEGTYYLHSENWCRVTAMEFQKISGSWKLTLINLNTIGIPGN
jgi:hypothetical protein